MAYLEAKHITFQYALSEKESLKDVSFQIEKGDFALIFGETGSGKSTLLKLLKPNISPEGNLSGSILLEERQLSGIGKREEVERIGYVSQSPENQLVTDKVWHELAFTLENLGIDQVQMRRRVAEMASFFGITDWFDKSVNELSGGQKQILNLASVMIAQPEILILDEPTSQLDPVATENFIALLKRINEEFGVTVLLSEHRLDEALSRANRCLILEQGHLLYQGNREDMVGFLVQRNHDLVALLPAQTTLPMYLSNINSCFTIRDAKNSLTKVLRDMKANQPSKNNVREELSPKDSLCCLQNVWFRYEKDGKDILKDFSMSIYEGDFISVFGANGQGKSTLLSLLCGLEKPYRGKIRFFNQKALKQEKYQRNISMLPQHPQNLFVKSTVEEELRNIDFSFELYAEEFQLTDLLNQHPYDLSGGQQQMLALAKVIMTKPRILLLDEPTKGVDQIMKQKIASILKRLNQDGTTILLVSHDVDFCANNTKTSYFMFEGGITAMAPTKELLGQNYFYTSTTNKIVREFFPNLILESEVLDVQKL